MVVSVICRSFLQNIKKINFDSVRDGGHFTGLPFLLTTRQEQAGAELLGLLREGFKNQINYFRGIFREGGTPSPPFAENNYFFPKFFLLA